MMRDLQEKRRPVSNRFQYLRNRDPCSSVHEGNNFQKTGVSLRLRHCLWCQGHTNRQTNRRREMDCQTDKKHYQFVKSIQKDRPSLLTEKGGYYIQTGKTGGRIGVRKIVSKPVVTGFKKCFGKMFADCFGGGKGGVIGGISRPVFHRCKKSQQLNLNIEYLEKRIQP